jgi:uncharacterized protein (TIGR02453 family)
MLQPSTLKFILQLKKNNNKEWFETNRKVYEAAKLDFENFVGAVLAKLSERNPAYQNFKPKDCTFRINRDVRFSKDKSPYKANMGASFNPGGKKAQTASPYFHLQPGGESFVGGGLWMPEPKIVKNIRQEIDYNLPTFKKIVEGRSFKKLFGGIDMSAEYKLTRVPKDYAADNPAAEYLKLKSYTAFQPLTDEMLTDKKLLKTVLNAFIEIEPMLNFLNHGMIEEG